MFFLWEPRAPKGFFYQPHFSRELPRLELMEEDGLVVCAADGSLRATDLGRLLIRNVAAVFDAYLAEQQKQEKPIFSRTV